MKVWKVQSVVHTVIITKDDKEPDDYIIKSALESEVENLNADHLVSEVIYKHEIPNGWSDDDTVFHENDYNEDIRIKDIAFFDVPVEKGCGGMLNHHSYYENLECVLNKGH